MSKPIYIHTQCCPKNMAKLIAIFQFLISFFFDLSPVLLFDTQTSFVY